MSKKKLSKLLALYLPYVVIGLLATNLGEAWRLAVGKELGDKIVSLMGTIPVAFANPLPSLHRPRSSCLCRTLSGRFATDCARSCSFASTEGRLVLSSTDAEYSLNAALKASVSCALK